MPVVVEQIQYGTGTYKLALELRYEILRKPLGLEYSKEDLAKEKDDFHFVAYSDHKIAGYLMLSPLSKNEIKMRQVAVGSNFQGKGIGGALVEAAEKFALANGYTVIILNAREPAVKFYTSRGYVIYGEAFIEVTIPHRKMKKALKS
jgi:predicted GNAT family N-acyltransferase